jgi:hypothetical protein
MSRGMRLVPAIVGALLVMAAPASAASKNVRLMDNLPEAKYATAINFLQYGHKSDVMLVTGRFGLKSYSLKDPARPRLLDEITAEDLRLPGDPPVNFDESKGALSTFWQNEDMDVDRDRKLALISRDPRSYLGTTSGDPGQPNTTGATNIAGVYIVDAKHPAHLKLLSFEQLPTGHTTTCINDCKWLWTGGPASTDKQKAELAWTFGRPIIVTDLRDPRNPVGHPMDPVDLFRRDGVTAYSHDVQVDDTGIAWISGDGGTRGYWTDGSHYDPIQGKTRLATPLDPVPYGGGGLPQSITNDATGGFEHNAWRPVGKNAPRGDERYRKGELLLATEEDFGPAEEGCSKQGMFSISSLTGSFNGEAWRSTADKPFRLETVGTWYPGGKEGSRDPDDGPFDPDANFCSAHYFDVDGPVVTYAWYGEGTRFLDISDPANPRQFAYWRPDEGIVWASYLHRGYVYTADHVRGVDVLKFTPGAASARKDRRAVVAAAPSARHRAFMSRWAWRLRADPATGGICYLAI